MFKIKRLIQISTILRFSPHVTFLDKLPSSILTTNDMKMQFSVIFPLLLMIVKIMTKFEFVFTVHYEINHNYPPPHDCCHFWGKMSIYLTTHYSTI